MPRLVGSAGRPIVGFRFRQSFRIIPGLRLNLSLGGPSLSLGGRGLHYTIGRKGTRVTAGIPGSGLSWTDYQPYPSGRNPRQHPQRKNVSPSGGPQEQVEGLSANNPNVTVFESAPIDKLVASSTNELTRLCLRPTSMFPLVGGRLDRWS
jgi:Protein of unknown function (DUF4236)